jgi:hypothetical protein
MWEALKICLPITLMTFAIFTRSNMVITTGWPQIFDTALVLAGTAGVAFAMFGRYTRSTAGDVAGRILLAALAGIVLFHPNDTVALATSPLVLAAVAVGLWRHRIVAPGTAAMHDAEGTGDRDSEELSAMVMEAKREV